MDGWMDGDGCNWKSIFYPSPRWIIVAIICFVSNNGGGTVVIFWPRFFLVIHGRETHRCKFSTAVARDGDARVFVLCFQRIFGSSILCFLGNEAREPWFRCCLYLLLLTEKRRSSRIKPKREQGNRVSFAIFRCTHTERLTLTKATTFSFLTFRSNFYRDISRNDNKGCVKPFGFDAKNKYACHTTKCLESFLDKYKQECTSRMRRKCYPPF